MMMGVLRFAVVESPCAIPARLMITLLPVGHQSSPSCLYNPVEHKNMTFRSSHMHY